MPLVNGEERDALSVFDRGLAYGDGLFETIRVVDCEPRLLDAHMKRLADGCQRLAIKIDTECIVDEARALCLRAGDDNVLKIIVTRGEGGAYRAPDDVQSNRILTTMRREPWSAECYTDGVDVKVCAHRLPDNPALAGIKHLNRLDQVIARGEWGDEYAEGLMLDAAGRVIEGTMSNVLLRCGDKLLTPRLDRAGVAGVMRARVMERLAESKTKVEEGELGVSALFEADGVFVCNSLIGVCPVRSIDGRSVSLMSCDETKALCGETA